MRSKSKKQLLVALCLLTAFVLWTVLVCTVDVQRIGPLDSAVGLASLNGPVRDLVGVRMPLYTLTDWLGLVPIATAVGFATVNAWFHRLTGVHMALYTVTDWLGLIPVLVCVLFAAVGAAQL